VKDVNFIFLVIGIQPCCNFLLLMLDSFFFLFVFSHERSFICDVHFKTFQGLGRLALALRGKSGRPLWKQQLLGIWKAQLPKLRGFALHS
jgi:hypothetical protein